MTRVTFLHTADWQLGKPFAGVGDVQKRSLLQQERVDVIHRIGETAREHQARFVVVAGDLFDSPGATKATVSAACGAIGALRIPVFAIPGNHDHGGPGSLWEQAFFQQEQALLAPNLRILLSGQPLELDEAVLLPCPLLRRHETRDPTTWLRVFDEEACAWGERPRIVLAHGSVQGFTSAADDEESGGAGPNQIDLARLSEPAFDYIALGDWHGMKQVGPKAWYAGTPELDRFPKGSDHAPGHVLVVTACRGAVPVVKPVFTARLGWRALAHTFSEESGLTHFEERMTALLGGRVGQDLVELVLDGSLGLEAMTQLEQRLEAWRARLVRLRLEDRTAVAPTPEELAALTRRVDDPLISRVAAKLVDQASSGGEPALIAGVALRELHAVCTRA